MAEEKKKAPAGPKVSPARRAVSAVLLLAVGSVCVIELRAGIGQMMSGKALAAKSNDGEFTDLTLEDARGMLSFAPKETVEERGPDRMHRFEWYSLLRPLMNQKHPNLSIIASTEEKSMALAFTTVDEEPEPADTGIPAPPPSGGPESEGMMGGMGGMGRSPGGMSPGGAEPGGDAGTKRPEMEDEAAPADAAPAGTEAAAPAETPAATEPAAPAETPAPANP